MVLRVVVFGSGAVLMGLEIVGSRVLAPYFGSSVYVWGSLISIFLAALSLGYYLGGRAADRWPRAGVLAGTISMAGVLTLLLPVISRPVLEAFSVWDLGPRLTPLLASIALFVLPSVLMGATSPFAIKLAATDLATVGNTAGLLYAISTAGSIAGTLLTAFALIPAMGVRAILYALGGSLLAFSALLAAKAVRTRVMRPVVTTTALMLVLLAVPALAPYQAQADFSASSSTVASFGTGLAQGELRLLFEKDTVYHRIRIYEDATWRYLRFDRSLQGGMLLKDPYVSPLRYPDYFLLAWLFKPDIKRVLVVGLGSGSISKRILKEFPQTTVDSVELDPVVVDLAKKYFLVTEDTRHRIFVEDGRRYIVKTADEYDLIVMDAYFAEGVPFHLVTQEFFEQVKAKLNPGGIIAANIVGFLGGPNSKLFRSIYKTYASEFTGLYLFPVSYSIGREEDAVRTIILFSTGRPGIARKQLVDQFATLRRQKKIPGALLERFLDDYYDKLVPTADMPLLTDDYSPVDILPVWGWEPERR